MASEFALPEDLQRRLAALGVVEADLVERFIKGSGPGGQKINKTSSCVQLRHTPSGIELRCQQGRSLTANRIEARRLLCESLEKRERLHRERRRAAIEKRRRRNRRPSRRQRQINVANKRRHGEKKRLRRRPGSND